MTSSFKISDLRDDRNGRVSVGAGAPRPDPRSELAYLRQQLEDAEDRLEAVKREPSLIATVLEVRKGEDRMTITPGPGGMMDVAYFEGAKVGDRVTCARNSLAVVSVLNDETPCGTVITISRGNEDGGDLVESEIMGQMRTLRATSGHTFKKGERAIADHGMTFVIGSLGMPPQTLNFSGTVSVSWDAIGGQGEAKEALREAIELPFSHPELFKRYGKRPSRGVLVSGPAGCGKTMLGKAAATALARAHGKTASEGFVYVKGPELLSGYVGKTEEAIRRLFLAARAHKERCGYPALIFMDECEALLGVRDRGANISMAATIVPQFLAEMDGLDDAAAMFLLATNRPDMLDPAIVRDGRIDRKVRVGRPTQDDAAQIVAIHANGRPFARGFDRHALVQTVCSELYADTRVIRQYDQGTLVLRDFVSGAMLAAIIENAATAAMLRDVASSARDASGISPADVVAAVDRAQASVRDICHGEAIATVIEAAGK